MQTIETNKGRVLFLGKEDDDFVDKALAYCQRYFADVTVYLGHWGQTLPDSLWRWDGDYIISYLSRWIVPEPLLQRAKVAALNFHPGSPNYPGIGCYNIALYDRVHEYGVTCHHMATRIDTGGIIAVRRFPVLDTDDVTSLISKTYECQLRLFYEIINLMRAGKDLPVSEERWTRKPYTRRDLNQLIKITVDMDPEEIARRVRATSYGDFQPQIELGGFVFKLKPPAMQLS